MTTGQRIKAARKKVGVTQEDLGKKLGVSPSFVAQYETGKRNPKLETLQRIANALDVSIYELIDGDDLKRAVIYGEGLDGERAQITKQDGRPVEGSTAYSPRKIRVPVYPATQNTDDEDAALNGQDEDSRGTQYRADFDGSHSRFGFSEDAPDIHTHTWLSGLGLAKDGGLTAEDLGLSDAEGLTAEDFGLVENDELEELLDKLQDGKPLPLSPDKLAKLKNTPKEQIAAALDEQEKEKQERLKKLPEDFGTFYCLERPLTEWLNGSIAPRHRIVAALDKLNDEGQEKAAERVEELTEIPRYQRQEPAQKLTKEELRESLKRLGMDKLLPDGPQDTSAPQEDKDTTPAETPSKGPQEPPEGRIQSITMFCPICGMTLRGDPATGKAFCHYCNRSFPLPKKARGPRR